MKGESKEISLLLEEKETVLRTRFLGIPINWKIGKMTLRKMLKLAKLYQKMQIDEEAIESEDTGRQLAASYNSVVDNAKLATKVIAIAVDSRIPNWILRHHFLRSIDSFQLKHFTYSILEASNFANFTMSIFLMNGSRVSKPKKID